MIYLTCNLDHIITIAKEVDVINTLTLTLCKSANDLDDMVIVEDFVGRIQSIQRALKSILTSLDHIATDSGIEVS